MATLRTLGSLDVTVDESVTDLDSDADQCAVGSNSLIVHDYDRPINVLASESAILRVLLFKCDVTLQTKLVWTLGIQM